MPPKQARTQPTPQQRGILVGCRTSAIAQAASAHPTANAMRRLNVAEYRASVQAVAGIPYDPTRAFASDPRTAGSDTVGSGLTTSPLHLETWLGAARALFDRALVDEDAPAPRRFHRRIRDPIWNSSYEDRKVDSTSLRCEPGPSIPSPKGCRWAPMYGESSGGDAHAAIGRFASRAWSRPPAPADSDRVVGAYDAARRAGHGRTAALRTAFSAVVCSRASST